MGGGVCWLRQVVAVYRAGVSCMSETLIKPPSRTSKVCTGCKMKGARRHDGNCRGLSNAR